MMVDLQWSREFALEQSGDDEEILAELLDLFRESAASDVEKIKEGLSSGNPVAAGDAAHSIKGAAASLGVEGIRQISYEMEKAGRAGDVEIVKQKLPELEAFVAQLSDLK